MSRLNRERGVRSSLGGNPMRMLLASAAARLRVITMATLLVCSGSSMDDACAGEREDQAAAMVKEAEAAAAAEKYREALKLYEEALSLIDDRGVLVEAARCAYHARAYLKAVRYLQRARSGANEDFLTSEKGVALAQLAAEVENELPKRDRFIVSFMEASIKALPKRKAVLNPSVVEEWYKKDEFVGYKLKPQHRGDDFRVSLTLNAKDGNVSGTISHTFTERESAGTSFDALASLIRKQKASWEALSVLKTKTHKATLLEVSDDPFLGKMRGDRTLEKILYFTWSPEGHHRSSSSAIIELMGPPADGPTTSPVWEVELYLYSSWFK
jgi:tetratricopeptide (TPR) repeat protein